MSTLLDLDTLIANKIADAAESPADLQDLLACLVAGVGLAVALAADGDARAANDLCERVSINVFEVAASQAPLVDMARGRA
jgi:hypothetical protein